VARRPDGSWRRLDVSAHVSPVQRHTSLALAIAQLEVHAFGGPRVARNLYVRVAARKGVTRSSLPVIEFISEPTQNFRSELVLRGSSESHSDSLEDDPFGTLAIPFAIENTLPGTQVEVASSDRNDDFVPYG
jgi:hypothetical protein